MRLADCARQRGLSKRISLTYPMPHRFLLLATAMAAVAICPVPGWAQIDPASLPARDAHQGLLVAADPYLSPDRYKEKFSKKTPYDAGVAAVDIYLRNDGAAPLKIDLDSIRLEIGAPGEAKQKLNPIAPEDVADMVLIKNHAPDPKARRLPLPMPGGVPKSGKGKEWDQFAGQLRSLALSTDVIAPHSMAHGFLYFDISGKYDWLPGSRMELEDVSSMLDHKPLLYFELEFTSATHN